MNSPFIFLCCIVGHIAGYNVQREIPYNTGPNDPYSYYQNGYEPSQRLFWGNNGSNQVGGTGLWATLTNKFPFLNNMFGKMELGPEYRSADVSQLYRVPDRFQQQYYQPQVRQQNVPSTRDVGLTDDAVIITPPDVPIAPELPTRPQTPTAPQFPTRPQYPTAPQYPSVPQYPSAPQYPTVPQYPSVPQYPTAPQYPSVPQYPTVPQYPSVPQYPTVPQPAPEAASGYQYNKPLYRLELPHK